MLSSPKVADVTPSLTIPISSHNMGEKRGRTGYKPEQITVILGNELSKVEKCNTLVEVKVLIE